jgi:diadenosine tetraphosphatase ApaH/serine/threonine PP2A family protein phosphatase
MHEEIRAARPWVQVAALCHAALIENTGHLSVIRITDRIQLAGVTPEMQPMPLQLTMALLLKSDEMRGQYQIKIRCVSPRGETTDGPEIPFVFAGADQGVQTVLPIGLIAGEQGVYWFEVVIEPDEILTRVPLRVMYQRVQLPPGTQLPPGMGPIG